MADQHEGAASTAADGPPGPAGPLLPSDPPRVGPFWLDARICSLPSGTAYLAHDSADLPVVVVRLSEGAAADAAARDRLAGLVNKLHIDTVIARGGEGQDQGRWARKFLPERGLAAHDDIPEAPWVALQRTGTAADTTLAEHLLAEVQLNLLPQQGTPSGPTYRHYWLNRARPGLTKVWPLPWPGRHERAGWVSILVSWLLTALLLVVALLLAWLLFKDMPEQSPPPPIDQSQTASPQSGSPPPQSGSPSPQSGSPSPQSGSPSPQSGSPSPQSGSPSSGPSGSPSSASASPQPSGTESGGGQQSPRSRL